MKNKSGHEALRRYWLLGLWLAGILFPLGRLGNYSAQFRRAFDTAFGAETMHVVMHFILYMGLVLIVFWVSHAQLTLRFLIVAPALVLLVGLAQELFQAWSNDHFLLGPLAYDLGVDLTGGFMGLALVAAWEKLKKRKHIA